MKVIAIANQKGGISKTTTVLNLAGALSEAGKKVLAVDLDTQGDLSFSVGLGIAPRCMFDTEAAKLVQNTVHGFDIIPTSTELYRSEAKQYDLDFSSVVQYDYVLLDCPPNVAGNTMAALRAADSIIIPTTADVYSYKSVRAIAESIHYLRANGASKAKIGGVLVTRYAGRLIINRQILDDLKNLAADIGTKLYNTAVRESVSIRESELTKQTVLEYDTNGAGAEDYRSFAKEVLEED